MTKTYSQTEIDKLKQIVTEGIQVHSEVEALKEALKDTVKAIADEMDIKPAVLNKAIRTAYAADLEEKREALSDVEDILVAVGRDF
jgi:division protein CdvB (Snf7/Vps24/ESCRT-III family)